MQFQQLKISSTLNENMNYFNLLNMKEIIAWLFHKQLKKLTIRSIFLMNHSNNDPCLVVWNAQWNTVSSLFKNVLT